MSIIETINQPKWSALKSISLHELNAKAEMLTRLDNKYMVKGDVLHNALPLLANYFDVLEINEKRLFTYETCYFDDESFRSFFDHHQGRRQRLKVRVRKYVDADLCFVEIKFKDIRGITIKKRLPYDIYKFGVLDAVAYDYICMQHKAMYGREFTRSLKPTLNMTYERATLVAKDGGERITIDRRIQFDHNDKVFSTPEDIYVVETKSINGNGMADTLLRKLHQHPTNKCSKYCIGMCLTEQVHRFNNFLPVLRKLGVLDQLMKSSIAKPRENTNIVTLGEYVFFQ